MDLKQFETQVETKVKGFRSAVDKMEASENPYYTSEVIAFETGKLKDQLESEVADINANYQTAVEAELITAQENAARSHFTIGSTDQALADHHLDTFISDAAFSYNDNQKNEAFAKLERNLDYLSPAQLDHLRKQLPKALGSVSSDEVTLKNLRRLNGSLSQLQTPERDYADKIQAASERTPDMVYRRLKMTHKAYVGGDKRAVGQVGK